MLRKHAASGPLFASGLLSVSASPEPGSLLHRHILNRDLLHSHFVWLWTIRCSGDYAHCLKIDSPRSWSTQLVGFGEETEFLLDIAGRSAITTPRRLRRMVLECAQTILNSKEDKRVSISRDRKR